MTKALFLLADGFEELEFVAPFDILHRGGVQVKTASISDKLEVVSARGLKVLADMILQPTEFDMLILPGGPGVQNLLASEAVKNLVIKSNEAGKQIAAICAAPKVLANAGILGGHAATSFPATRAEVEPFCKRYLDAPVVISENIITSKGAGTAAEFGFCLLSLLVSAEKAAEVKGQMKF